MALEAGFFFLPSIFWGQTNSKSGLNITNMIELAQTANTSEDAARNKTIVTMCHHIEDSVRLRQVRLEDSTPMSQWFKFGLISGCYVTNVYMVTKVMYLINVIGQFLMMNQFLGQNNHFWGTSILTDIIHGRDWELSGNFPRIAMCDFQVRTLGNLHRYSIQCVLVLNMFNEKLFLFLYYWFITIGILTFIDAIVWTVNTRITSRRIAYVMRYVKPSAECDYLFSQFCTRSIPPDAILLLRLISSHSNELVTSDVLNYLWKTHTSSKQSLNNIDIIENHFSNRKERIDSRNSYEMDTPLVLIKHNV
ncbi:hypothetical protein L596_002690 [Steinernema carpocapsae]|uniref:Innexin n=1 Tax=Steinernema carpocapsae TaxID=34508 RepID=A0A4U8UQB4_STECR|nr:hypothetical protein L596_002690 [Steinernema carpocapsae]